MLDTAAEYPSAEQVGGGNFMMRLLDLSFTTFVTPLIIRTIYIIGLVVAAIVAGLAVLAALFQEGFWAFIWALIFAPVWLLVVAIILRVVLEVTIAVFRIAQASIETAKNTGTQL